MPLPASDHPTGLLKPGEIELLAPARDLDAGRAAIDYGADALYIGAPRFGAREQAGNTLETIAELILLAHRYWCRVYITLNTLLHDHELDEAVALTHQLHDLGADGLIIQDAGLLEAELPPLPLIASTQMHNHTPARAAFLEAAGFQRIILARELGLDQIEAIRKACRIELECFIHGALCVSYSGQCYLSLARGGRSGNRGQCAQPCRLPYRLLDGTGRTVAERRHLLSLRDLNLTAHLGDLLDAGVTSFKIEGRLKEADYVKNIVTWYRSQLDALLPARGLRPSSSGRSAHPFTADPCKSFNRGFTTYFLTGPDPEMTAPATPKFAGEPLGTVRQCRQGLLELASGAPALHNGDGLTWFDAAGTLQGVRVNRVEGGRAFLDLPLSLPAGTRMARNYDHAFLAGLKKAEGGRTVAVRLRFYATLEGFGLEGWDEEGVAAHVSLAAAQQPARDAGLAERTLRAQLSKSGGTLFRVENVQIDWPEAYFLPVALINRIRRELLADLLAARVRAHPLLRIPLTPNDVPFPETRLGFTGNVLNRRARAFYHRHGVQEIEPAAESGMELRGQRVMTTRYCLRRELGLCGKALQAAGFTAPLFLIDDQEQRLRLEFRCEACEMEVYLPE